ncbi:MAG TPA: hypothetical protein VHN18_02645, partial [Micromonosporaceae bacterium]|nr:hypothetical protein [Micromonosporaceae bacterium]
MAFRTWGRVLLAALGVAAFAGAAQLGFAYGLGVVRFGRVFDPSAEGLWAAQVAWVAWFAIVAAVAGAVAGGFLANRWRLVLVAWAPRLAVIGASAVGALAVAPLAMLPARAAQLTSINLVLTAGLAAVLGALIGAAAALAALSHRPFAWNIALVVGGVWLVTLLSVAPSLGPTDPLPDVRLGVVDPASLSDATANRLAVLTMPTLALLAGMACGLLSRSRPCPTVVAAGCGAIGPALVALAYLAAGPGGADSYQAAPYWGALIGAGAGALGSVLATVVRLPNSRPDRALGRRFSPGPHPGLGPRAASVPGPEPATAPVVAAEAEPVRDAPAEPVPTPGPAEQPVTAALPLSEPADTRAENRARQEVTSPRPSDTTHTRTPDAWFDQPQRPVEAAPHRPGERKDDPGAGVPERHPVSPLGPAEPAPAPAGRPGAPLGGDSWNA